MIEKSCCGSGGTQSKRMTSPSDCDCGSVKVAPATNPAEQGVVLLRAACSRGRRARLVAGLVLRWPVGVSGRLSLRFRGVRHGYA